MRPYVRLSREKATRGHEREYVKYAEIWRQGETMRNHGLLLGTCLLIAGLCFVTPALVWAQFPGLFSSNNVEADPEKRYDLTQTNGPWLIMACTFEGDGAVAQAHELLMELRSEHNMEAFLYRKVFENQTDDMGYGYYTPSNAAADPRQFIEQPGFSGGGQQPVPGQYEMPGFAGRPREAHFKYYKDQNLTQTQYAVMVGNFASLDDSRIQETLEKIKMIRPSTLMRPDSNATMAGWRVMSSSGDQGPMRMAFALPNPLGPGPLKNSVDDFVVHLNADSTYNLLEVEEAMTLRVATFMGRSTIVVNRSRNLEERQSSQGGGPTALEKAGIRAARLCQALRIKGYEAYEFHDREYSMVTVGSWSSAGTATSDERIMLDPEIYQLMQAFRARDPGPAYGSQATYRIPTELSIPNENGPDMRIQFDNEPILVEVPRRSLAANYAPVIGVGASATTYR